MDIHRCRFVPYPPSCINSVAFSHTSCPNQRTPHDLRLAVGRDNGDIELWNPNGGLWSQEKILKGSAQRIVEQIVWTQELNIDESNAQEARISPGKLRLFSSGGSTTVTEWDYEKGVPRAHAESNSADVWCLAAQPQWNVRSPKLYDLKDVEGAPSQLIAGGCSDGSIVLFSTGEDGLRYERMLSNAPKKKSRVISLTWRDRFTVVAGFEESLIRVIDVRDRRVVRNITLGKAGDGSSCYVWAVRCLPNGAIVSGDSSGELKIWDPQNFSLVQRLKSHRADVVEVTCSADGTMLYSVGVDRRTVAYRLEPSVVKGQQGRWERLMHRRFHTNDVKTIASFESKDMSIAVSGGNDATLVVLPLRSWSSEYHRTLPTLPQKSQIAVSSDARLLLSWWGPGLSIYQLPPRVDHEQDADIVMAENDSRKLLARIELKDEESIMSADISARGDLISVSTTSAVKLFQIRQRRNQAGLLELRSRQIDLPAAFTKFGAAHVGFSPDGKWLYATRLNNVLVVGKIINEENSERPSIHERVVKLGRRKRQVNNRMQSLGSYDKSISSVSFSSDSRIIAVGDLSGAVDAWILEGHESHDVTMKDDSESSSEDSDSESDSDDETDTSVIHGQKWIRNPAGEQLPKLDSAILTMSFKPSQAEPSAPGHVHGNDGLHATRHNPHPVSHEMPSADAAHLVAITATHQIVEFDVLKCKLSDWTRRNPSTSYPKKFKELKDRVMGVWWDCQATHQRLWIYGSTYVFMVDMARDLKEEKVRPMTKIGQLGEYDVEVDKDSKNEINKLFSHSKKRKRNTGAGDEMRNSQKYSATVTHSEDTGMISPVSDDEFDADQLAAAVVSTKEHETESNKTDKQSTSLGYWHTFMYRSILGACALHNNGREAGEVVIVERPLFDIDLPERMNLGQEWAT